jgi:hypothetical protein
MRKRCNFQLPRPLVLQSTTRGLKRNGYVKYIIYPDLSRFKRACLHCPYIYKADKRYFCRLDDPDFMLKFYGIQEGLPSGVLLCVGGVPSYIKAHRVGVEVESYFSKHSERLKKGRKLRTLNKNSGDTPERRGALPLQSKGVGRSPKVRVSSDRSDSK